MPVDVTENNIRIRQRDPGDFQDGSFRTIDITEGVKAIIGRPKGKSTTEVQSYLFDKDKFTTAKARKWISDHAKKAASVAVVASLPFKAIGDLPSWVRRRSKEEQERYMEVCNGVFRETGSETDARRKAAAAIGIGASVKWADMRLVAGRDKSFHVCEFFVSDVFPDWDASGVYEVQVMRTGLWRDHPEYGDIEITAQDVSDAVRNYRNASRRPFLDDEHGITHPQLSTRPGESFGWMRDMWIEDVDGNRLEPKEAMESDEAVLILRAEYEVNSEANEWLKEKTKALFSPTFFPTYYNKETGELQGMTILGGAMTNAPYFDGMDGFRSVAASERLTAETLAEMFPKATFQLSMPPGMSHAEAISRLDGLGLETMGIDHWMISVSSNDGADLKSKLAEIGEAGFEVISFWQGVRKYAVDEGHEEVERRIGQLKGSEKGSDGDRPADAGKDATTVAAAMSKAAQEKWDKQHEIGMVMVIAIPHA